MNHNNIIDITIQNKEIMNQIEEYMKMIDYLEDQLNISLTCKLKELEISKEKLYENMELLERISKDLI